MDNTINVKKRNGRLEELNVDKINKVVERACENIENVSASEIVLDAHIQLYNKITSAEIDKALILCARSKIEKDPGYSFVAARLLLQVIYKEVFKENSDSDVFELQYKSAFVKNIKSLVKNGILNEKCLSFDLRKLADALQPERDFVFRYHGIQNVYDRYLIRYNGLALESPQAYYMRIAMGLCFEEENKEDMAISLYNIYSQHLASPSSPTLFNSGKVNNQLSSCYLSEIDDSIDGIFDGLWQEARKSKYAGGLGFHFSKVRGTNAYIKGTNGKSSGLIPWLKIFNDMLIAVNQGGLRNGSGCAYLENWHMDIEEFLDLRKESGEERRRTHDLNTALWVSNLFIDRVEKGEDWTLFCPSETSDLTDLYGTDFEKRYAYYENEAKNGNIKRFKILPAKELWKEMLKSYYSTSHPWICFKDNFNYRYQNNHEGTLHGSNLCVSGETLLTTKQGDIIICDNVGKKVEVWNGKQWSETEIVNTGWSKFIEFTFNAYDLRFPIPTYSISQREPLHIKTSTLRTTLYHKFYLEDGSQVEAKDLNPGDVLMPFVDHEGVTWKYYLDIIRYDVGEGQTYCVNEPLEHKAVFNGILTANCTEIGIYTEPSKYLNGKKTSTGKTGVCTLSSINLASFVNNKKIDYKKLGDTIKFVIRALDNAVSASFYPTEEAQNSALTSRDVGMGTMGWADVYYKMDILQDSEEGVKLADELTEFVSFKAIEASCLLSKERGTYKNYEGSNWSKGIIPIDTYVKNLEDRSLGDNIIGASCQDWDYIRKLISENGIRNAQLMAIAPNASIAYQLGVEQSIEPSYSVLFVYENKSGKYYIINEYFVNDMKKEGLWNPILIEGLKIHDGNISQLNIPEKYKRKYCVAFDRNQFMLLKATAARQKWICQAISFNCWNKGTSLKFLSDYYIMGNKMGLKSHYYLRNVPASKAQKSTVEVKQENPEQVACSIEAMKNGGTCEMCEG